MKSLRSLILVAPLSFARAIAPFASGTQSSRARPWHGGAESARSIILAALAFLLANAASAVNLYSTGFDNPPFTPGVDIWAGTDGWVSTDTSSGIQGILSDQTAYLGFNAPTTASNFIWRPLNYDPVEQQNSAVHVGVDIAIMDSTNSKYDQFEIQIYNTSGVALGGIYLNNADLRIWRSDGATRTDTGVKFTNDSFHRLSLDIDFSANTWSAAFNSTPLFTNAPFHAASGALDLGDLTYAWFVATPGSPGDNYLVTDNLTISAGPLSPTVTTPTSSAITHNSAMLGGNVTSNGGAALIERGVIYSISTANSDPVIGGPSVTKVVAGGTGTGVFTTPVTGLTSTTSYSYKAYATTSVSTSYTSVGTFTTSLPPDAVSLYATGFDNPPFVSGADTWAETDGWQSTSTSSGNHGVTTNQQAYLGFNPPPADSVFVWKPLNYDPIAQQKPIVEVGMDIAIVDSDNGQHDKFGVQLYDNDGVLLGGIYVSTTDQHIWRSDGVTQIDTGVAFAKDLMQRLAFSVNYSTNTWTASLNGAALFTNASFHAGSGTLNLGDLTYVWWVETPGSPGDNYLVTDNLSISARPIPVVTPTVTTPTSGAITHNEATLGGNVTSNGGASLTERGVVYSIATTNNNPVIGGTGVTKVVASGTATGSFSASASGLSAGTTYSFKAYATNSAGTTYTNPVATFTTVSPPAITTPTSEAITHNSAALGGNVTSNGGALLTERGVIYSVTSTNNNPVIGGPGVTKIVASGTTTDVLTAPVTGLTPSTAYSFKAFATNSAGTSYTNTGSFTTSPAPGAGDLDPLNIALGSGNNVHAIALQPDGKLIIAGSFSIQGVTTHRRIARLNADGTIDWGFNPNPNNAVYGVAIQPDGRILLAGSFTTLQPNGATTATPRSRIARLNADGILDSDFNPNPDSSVFCVAIQPDGKILLGGTLRRSNPTALPPRRHVVASHA